MSSGSYISSGSPASFFSSFLPEAGLTVFLGAARRLPTLTVPLPSSSTPVTTPGAGRRPPLVVRVVKALAELRFEARCVSTTLARRNSRSSRGSVRFEGGSADAALNGTRSDGAPRPRAELLRFLFLRRSCSRCPRGFYRRGRLWPAGGTAGSGLSGSWLH